MDTKKLTLGVVAWTLGIAVPVMHHVLLHWPLAAESTNNIITRSDSIFRNLPWIDWVYLAAMALVGLALVASGLRNSDNK